MKNILLFGNHSCSNRGDAAISRGIIECLDEIFPDAKISFYTRYVGAGRYILGRECRLDPLSQEIGVGGGVKGLIKKFFMRRLRPVYFFLRAYLGLRFLDFLLSVQIRKFIEEVSQADAFVQVGGSFFVDLYGVTQYEGALIALSEKKPIFLLGHSVGPFSGWWFRHVSSFVFARCNALLLRESASKALMQAAGVPTNRVVDSADTAWLVKPSQHGLSVELREFLAQPTVAITVRDLRPFSQRLNVTQDSYEAAVAGVAQELLSAGFRVVFASTCTGLESYGKDDRIVAARIVDRLPDASRVLVVMDELDDLRLGELYGSCRLVLATRLHSAIIAMRCGTPAIAIYYEHKSLGIFEQMELEKNSIRIEELTAMAGFIVDTAKGYDQIRVKIQQRVDVERSRAEESVRAVLSVLR